MPACRREIFPETAGLILADAWGAEILREPPRMPLAAARRKAMTIQFAKVAAHRLHGLFDPEAGSPEVSARKVPLPDPPRFAGEGMPGVSGGIGSGRHR